MKSSDWIIEPMVLHPDNDKQQETPKLSILGFFALSGLKEFGSVSVSS